MKKASLMMLVIGALLALVVLGTMAVGCGGDGKETKDEEESEIIVPEGGDGEDLAVEEGGKIKLDYSNVGVFKDPDHIDTYHVVLQVTNTSDEYGAEDYYTEISLKNGSETVGSSNELCFWLAPGETRWVVSEIYADAPSADGADVSFSSITATEYDTDTWPVVEAQNVSIEESAPYMISGIFVNTGPVDIGQAHFILVCFDEAGNPVGCADAFSDANIPVGGKANLRNYLSGRPGVRFEVEATDTNIDA